MNYIRVDKDTNVSEYFEQSTVVCTDLCKCVVLILQKRSLGNSKSLLVKGGINRRFTIATDPKSCKILLGMMPYSCFHPCCWYEVKKKSLLEQKDTKNHGFFEYSPLRLFRGKYQ